jgi:hypothetical protein
MDAEPVRIRQPIAIISRKGGLNGHIRYRASKRVGITAVLVDASFASQLPVAAKVGRELDVVVGVVSKAPTVAAP